MTGLCAGSGILKFVDDDDNDGTIGSGYYTSDDENDGRSSVIASTVLS
eukprot:CAMPEP_0194441146 /NCGR_PEP_ID=MMETSP0176-20130528/120010_1 /TAXON_ID=216777 /ORGANISM="Proboscia alata, Strain PI-D3" /LENGTH=47 /DNA_ID= /DNA_START= /DNA_END= /DNA_ORIENTATION=